MWAVRSLSRLINSPLHLFLTSHQEPRDKTGQAADSSDEDEDSSSASEHADKPEMTREERRLAAKKRKEAATAKQKAKATAPGDMPCSSEESSEESSDEADDEMPANPNHTAKARSQAAAAPVLPDADGASNASAAAPEKKGGSKKTPPMSQLSRREREAIQAQQAKERYQKLHAEGKTDEARADLERLALVRERRQEEAARKKAEM